MIKADERYFPALIRRIFDSGLGISNRYNVYWHAREDYFGIHTPSYAYYHLTGTRALKLLSIIGFKAFKHFASRCLCNSVLIINSQENPATRRRISSRLIRAFGWKSSTKGSTTLIDILHQNLTTSKKSSGGMKLWLENH